MLNKLYLVLLDQSEVKRFVKELFILSLFFYLLLCLCVVLLVVFLCFGKPELCMSSSVHAWPAKCDYGPAHLAGPQFSLMTGHNQLLLCYLLLHSLFSSSFLCQSSFLVSLCSINLIFLSFLFIFGSEAYKPIYMLLVYRCFYILSE